MPPITKKTIKDKSQKAEWTYQGKKDFTIPENAIGFTYLIEVIGTPFYYYGKNIRTNKKTMVFSRNIIYN